MAKPDKLDYRCSPYRMFSLISHMNGGQKEMLKELGFGALLGLKDCNLRRNLIFWLLSRFNVDDGCLDVHGKHFKLDSKVFSATMGVNDGVKDLQRHGKPVEQPFYNKGEKNTVSLLEEKLRRRELADMSFVRQFLLFLVSVFLLPNTSLHVAREVEGPIMSLTDVAAVCRVNWASMAYTHLWKSISRYHGKASKFVGGCVYFLQVFYYHHIIWKEGYVDRSLCPIGVWCDDNTKALLEWVEEEGGFESNTIPMLELQEGVDQLKLPATISSLCVMVESLEKKLFAKENEMDKFKEEMEIELEMGLQRLQQSLSTPNHHVIQIDNFKEEMKLYFDKGFERLHQSFNTAIGSMVPGNASPHISKEEAAKCVQFGKLTEDPIEPTIYLHEKTKLSQHKMTIDPMLLECGIGRPNDFEDSYRKGSISNIEREKGAIQNDFNDYEPTVLPSDKYNVDVGPYNAIQNVDGVLSCSGNEKIDVENEIGLEDDASKFRMEGKEKEKEDLGILNFEVIPEDVIPYEASVYGTTDTPVIHEIEDDDNVKIDRTILRRDKELCKMDKSFQDMILKYNKSKGRQIGAFNLKVALPQSKFELGLFLFDFSLSLRDVLVDNVMGQLERWYFRSLRPEAEVDMKIIDAFGCVLRYRDNPDGVIDDDTQTLIFPTYWPGLRCHNGAYFWDTGNTAFLGTNVNLDMLLKKVQKILVPMKDVENNHWILAVIHCQKGCASVWDSMSGRYRTRVRTHILSELLKKLDVLLHTTMGSASVGGPVFSVFSVVPSGQVPQQENGHDCGVFVMKFMEWIVDGESPLKSYKVADAARLDIAIDILTCESNRLRLGVKDNTTTYYKACLSSVEKSPDYKERSCYPPKASAVPPMLSTKKARDKHWSKLGKRKRKN